MNLSNIKNRIITSNHSISHKGETEFRIHCHDSYEILYFVSGDIHYIIEGETYYPAKNSLLLMPAGVVHGIEANLTDGYERYVAHIRFEALPDDISQMLKSVFSKDRYYILSESTEIRKAFEDMYKANELSGELFLPSLSALILKILLIQHSTDGAKPVNSLNQLTTDIINYVNESFALRQSLDEIAAKFFITKHYLNTVFKKATGITVWEYIIRKRIYYATTLIQSGVSATDAAEKSGFSDYSAFYKAYKKRTGKSPKNIR